jgi:hypothetical protein
VYVELNGKSYVRDARFKLTNRGELFDLSEAPYKEILIPRDSADSAAVASRNKLQEILTQHPTAPGRENPNAKKAAAKQKRLGRKNPV